MNKLSIIITETDHARLTELITKGALSPHEGGEVHALENILRGARTVAPEEVPPDVITMNSRAELLDLESNEKMELTVVFPIDANIDEGKISVLAPVGAGMLGYRVGDIFESPAPYGVRRLRVMQVHFQPESAIAAIAG